MKQMQELTIVICAKNAGRFIGRAIESAVESEEACVLLIDDFSDDNTVEEARRVGGDRLRVERPREPLGLGNARQTGLEAVETEYLMWLDADDALLPGRVGRMLAELRKGVDLVFDAAELYLGATDTFVKKLPVPDFLVDDLAIYRCFERNFLPGPAWPGARVEFARKIGYDPSQRACEDSDFLLRALLGGAKTTVLREIGYRQYAYEDSLSRDLEHQRSFLRRVLSKFPTEELLSFLVERGLDSRIANWSLCSISLFRADYLAAKRFVAEAFPREKRGAEVGGPWGVSDAWLEAFARGTIDLFLGGHDRDGWLDRCLSIQSGPDIYNNLGVALWRKDDRAGARSAFESALRSFPGYLDATRNLASFENPSSVTSHPLRRLSYRSDY